MCTFQSLFFVMEVVKIKIPIREVLIRMNICDIVVYGCCREGVRETIEHLFINCEFLRKNLV